MARTEIHTIDEAPDRWLIRTSVRDTSAVKLIANTRARRTANPGTAEWTVPATAEAARQLKTSLPDARWTKAAANQRAELAKKRKERVELQTLWTGPRKWFCPDGSEEELAAFQASGAQWLGSGGGILADDMGLGKTVEMVAAAADVAWLNDPLTMLVLCPTSALAVWEHHLETWTSITPFTFHGPRRKKIFEAYLDHDGPKALISTHGLVDKHSDRVNYGSTPKEGEPGEFNIGFDIGVFDEAHRIGVDPEGKRVRATKSVANTCQVVWPSTGTPTNDHPRDMWVLMHYVTDVLGSYRDFAERYCIEREGKWRTENLGLHPDMEAEYEWLIKPWFLRRLKSTHGQHIPLGLPPQVIQLDMTGPQSRTYKQIVDKGLTRLDGADGTKKLAYVEGVLSKNSMLQYLANGLPILGDDGKIKAIDTKNSNKLAYVLEVAEERAGDPFMVYSYSAKEAHMYARGLREKGHKVGVLVGSTSVDKRKATLKLFQAGGLAALVVTNAGGDSITATAADLIILARPSWRPLENQQVMDRIRRWGQTREPVVQILVSRGTVDETRLASLKGKVNIQDEMNLDRKRMKELLTGAV